MKKILLSLCVALCAACGSAYGWGRMGHDAVAHIAECNLTPRAKKNLERCLAGRSIVYYASWMDEIRHEPAYRHTSAWHGADVDAACRYVPREKGDAVAFVETLVEQLRNRRSLDDSTVVVAIRFLVHTVADMHCPVHVKYPWYRNFEFRLQERRYEFHAFWDTPALELCHAWGYADYRDQLDRSTRRERERIAAGTPREWLEETARDCRTIHEWVEPGAQLGKTQSRDLLNRVRPLAEQQIVRAGYRLARILNELFG
ncbi:S1/P1 nuclease [Alistipes sp.]|uniref:S1/P1 nuclease n=1 Tax=Alistipes sp. TaxID=1872444 RepID=UPI003AEF5DCC